MTRHPIVFDLVAGSLSEFWMLRSAAWFGLAILPNFLGALLHGIPATAEKTQD